jgi:hypothetical protein
MDKAYTYADNGGEEASRNVEQQSGSRNQQTYSFSPLVTFNGPVCPRKRFKKPGIIAGFLGGDAPSGHMLSGDWISPRILA